jgi:hypothetical protein
VATDPYLLTVGNVNLASALVSARLFDEANLLLNPLIESESTGGNKRLLGNCYELRAQTHFHQNQILKAEEDLSSALAIFKQTNAYDEILVQKWRAIIESHKNGSILPLKNFKEFAIKRAHWESVREIDLYQIKTCFNQKDFDYLYFGTPYSSFRNRLKLETQSIPSLNYYIGDTKGLQLSLATGEYGANDVQTMNHKLQTLLTILCDDFYSPLSIGHIFTKIYPNEYFDIESSPLKVRQLVSRLRKWFNINKIKASILETDGRYRLDIKQGLGFYLDEERLDFDIFERSFAKLFLYFTDGKPFTVKDAEQKLKLSRSDFHRTMSWAIKLNKIKKYGQGKATFYQFTKPQLAAS